MAQILAPVSIGELLDKITILQIKSERITDTAKLANVQKELTALTALCNEKNISLNTQEVQDLKKVNEQLWQIEDDIRDKELAQEFDDRFIELARAVYVTNDKRAEIKKIINLANGSELVEEKSYAKYK